MDHLDAPGGEGGIGRGGERPVPVAQEEPALAGLALGCPALAARLLGGPGPGGRAGATGQVPTAAPLLDEEQHRGVRRPRVSTVKKSQASV